MSGGFRKVGEDEVFAGYIIRVAVGEFEAPDGTRFTRDVVHHPGAVGVVAVDDDGSVVLVRQYRAVVDTDLLEVPAGVRDKPGEPPLETAKRELVEEVGLEADEWSPLTTFFVAPGFSDEEFHLFLATGLREVALDRQGIEEQSMTVERVRLDDVPALVAAGEVRDAKTILGLLLARDRLG